MQRGVRWLGRKYFLILDVGCGDNPRGHVNVDLFLNVSTHRRRKRRLERTINLINADCYFLPFPNNSFTTVRSDNLIEHLEQPEAFIKECLRVAEEKVLISCPHRYSREGLRLKQSPSDAHKQFFNIAWFHETLKNFPHRVSCSSTPKPHRFLPLIQLPHRISVEILKVQT